MASQNLPNGLRDVNRYITTHNSSGQACYSEEISPSAKWQKIGDKFNFFLGYTTRKFPVDLDPLDAKDEKSSPADIVNYSKELESPPGLAVSSGTVCRFVDFAPGADPIMHRTVSLDYGVVLEGTMECILDSGEKRTMERGDVCVQRATQHAWKNVTPNEGWGRMMFVLVAAEAPTVAGKKLDEDLGPVMPKEISSSD